MPKHNFKLFLPPFLPQPITIRCTENTQMLTHQQAKPTDASTTRDVLETECFLTICSTPNHFCTS
uniref:Uncharacterized protein n=1 Tax=Rhizophora mucronata TaxID=61149 RepID=A0A2P2K1M9_RHIMU